MASSLSPETPGGKIEKAQNGEIQTPKISTAGILGLGTDLVDMKRMGKLLQRRPKIAERIFSDQERELSGRQSNPSQRLAARFAAKEAVMKALGVGFGSVNWRDIEVLRLESGAPSVRLSGRAAQLAKQKGINDWLITLSHTDTSALAVVIAQ